MNKLSTVVLAAAVVMVGAKLCLYTVGEREHALVFALGELKEAQSEPGLHFKLPPPFPSKTFYPAHLIIQLPKFSRSFIVINFVIFTSFSVLFFILSLIIYNYNAELHKYACPEG